MYTILYPETCQYPNPCQNASVFQFLNALAVLAIIPSIKCLRYVFLAPITKNNIFVVMRVV